jgi:hypothetical protein
MINIDKLWREYFVYPGHPTVIAVGIILEYNHDLNKAFSLEKGLNCPDAVCNNRIRGAGGEVREAVVLLKKALEGDIDRAINRANHVWISSTTNGYRTRQAEGQKLAEAVEPVLRKLLVEIKSGSTQTTMSGS